MESGPQRQLPTASAAPQAGTAGAAAGSGHGVSTAARPELERAHAHKWLVALAVMLGTVLEVLDSSIVNVSLPHMQGSFSASIDEIAWVLTSYLVANGIMIPLTGWISARFGRKRYFLTSVFTFVVASALCGAARSLGQMVVFRLIQGAAGAAMLPSSQAILMETFPPEEQQMAMATWGIGLMVAPILGPTLGGWITDNWNWRWNFYINVPVGAVALVMVSAFVHDPSYLRTRRAGGHVDYLGIVLLALWLGLLQIVLDRGQRSDWFESPWVVWATIISGVAMVALIFRELNLAEPILEFRFLKIRQFASAVFAVIVLSFILFGTGVLNPVFLQEFMGYPAWRAGIVMAPRAAGAMVSMLFAGQIARAGYDNKRLIGVSFAVMTVGLWLMSGWDLETSMARVIRDGVVLGVGLGMCFPILSAAALSGMPREQMGFAASLYNMTRNTGAAVGIAYLTNMLVRNQQVHQSHLVQHFSVFDAWRMSSMAPHAPGAPSFNFLMQLVTGQKQGLGMVYGAIQQQSAMLAFNDIYRMLALIALLMIPSFILFRGGPKLAGGGPAH
ncbi:MAG TPA: DHA2 family efflux MFS transporter permease subunit [Candidatus Binataceae bacterium]|nr:DHA2 family efflux MFS transporter permease subunit [Candidatus Binataceae bacterium]